MHKIRQLKHENIIEFIGLHQGQNDVIARTYLMEILDGSLYTLLDMVGGLYNTGVREESTEAIVSYTSQMINAVHYLHHQHKFCHRDIKPANFLIRSSDGVIKLSDFGTAKDVSGFDKYATGVSGSLQYGYFLICVPESLLTLSRASRYMDPQVLRGGEYGLETDIYCLGSTVWELVTGKHPYHNATSVQQLIQARQHADASLPIDDDWPDIIKEFLESCFSDPKLRPNAEALKEGDIAETAAGLVLLEDPEMWDADRVVTIRKEATEAMKFCMRQLQKEWQQAVDASNSKKQEDEDGPPPPSSRERDFEVLMPKIVDMLSQVYLEHKEKDSWCESDRTLNEHAKEK